jgi:flagellin
MSMTINTNISSLSAQRYLTKTQNSLAASMERLSSGLRINSAKDDAAGLGISTRLTAKISGMNQAVRNANDGISLLQTAEGATQEVTNILQRMRVLAVQSANGTYGTSDRTSMDSETTALKNEIDRISQSTQFNGIGLMDASTTSMTFQVGSDAGTTNSITVSMSKIDTTALSMTGSVATASGASALITAIDTALDAVSTARGSYGAVQNRLSSTISNLMNVSENLSAANGRIVDADFAAETANLAKQQILSQAGTAMLGQAKQLPQQVLELLK